ncbi:MAG: YkgJ family cysteine cluster protein [Desulfobacterales bacterium]|nr:YkgJ family cysteine cluster protein [Desulfobacterales bacterium]
MTEIDNRSYFFDAGIRFQCQQCGACCTGAPGVVRVSPAEAEAMAAFLNMSVQHFMETAVREIKGGMSLGEKDDGRCIFYEEGCRVYPVRPAQCRTYPFWFSVLRSEDRWQQVVRQCPGIGRGRLFSREEILQIVRSTF